MEMLNAHIATPPRLLELPVNMYWQQWLLARCGGLVIAIAFSRGPSMPKAQQKGYI
jgi:hypothetical protein